MFISDLTKVIEQRSDEAPSVLTYSWMTSVPQGAALSEANEIDTPGCKSKPVGSTSLNMRSNGKPHAKSLGLERVC